MTHRLIAHLRCFERNMCAFRPGASFQLTRPIFPPLWNNDQPCCIDALKMSLTIFSVLALVRCTSFAV